MELPIEFIEWLGESYIKMHGGWHPRFADQRKPQLRTTQELYEAYVALKPLLEQHKEQVKVDHYPDTEAGGITFCGKCGKEKTI